MSTFPVLSPGSVFAKDVVEYANLAAFPTTGAAARIYIDLETGILYRWNGSAYAVAGGASTVDDADASTKGVLQLAGALGGTAEAPTALGYADAAALATAIGLKANAADAALTGTPTAPTAAPGTNTTQIATAAFVQAAVDALLNAAPGALDTLAELAAALGDDANFAATMTAALAAKAPLASPALTGTPTVPTAAVDTNTTQAASTAFVIGQAYAKLASPALSGTPTAPTAAPGTNTTQVSTTAFVQAAIAALVDASPGTLDTLNELAAALADDPNFATTMTTALSLKAPLADPALTGVPTAPTAAPGTDTTQIATTAFVAAMGGTKATVNAPVDLAGATSLTASAHGNRQIRYSGANANLTVQGDTSGGTTNDDEFQAVTLDASAGVPTFALPGGGTIVGGKDVIAGAVRIGADTWRKYMVPEGVFAASKRGLVPAAGAVPAATNFLTETGAWAAPTIGGSFADTFSILTSRFGFIVPTSDNSTSWTSVGAVAPTAFDSSTATAPGVTNDALGRLKTIEYVQATNAVNRGAGWHGASFALQAASDGREQFPVAFLVGLSDGANATAGCALVGFGSPPSMTVEPSAMGNILGFGFDVADTNWQVMHNDGSGTATKVDLGASFVRAARTPYLFVIDRLTTKLGYDLYAVNLATGAVSAVVSPSTDLPSDRTTAGVWRWSMAAAFAPRVTVGGMVRGKQGAYEV